MPIQFSIVTSDEGQQFVTVYADGQVGVAADDHPNFKAIVGACEATIRGEQVNAADVTAMFDVAKTVTERFQRLTERVTVEGGVVYLDGDLDGDPVHGSLQDQIVDFVQQGEDFGPLVSFYEKLVTNPLGDVREGLYDWISGQRSEGNFTITPTGNVIGYKSVQSADPEWRTDQSVVYIPSQPSRNGGDRVNDTVVEAGKYIEQVPGDTVEMPRSKVLHAPSQACGDGLHIGTWNYAKGFSGDTVMLVEFDPRDIVSLPDRNSTWKLRVCRYKVIGPVDEPLDTPLYVTDEADLPSVPDLLLDGPLAEGDRVVDFEGDEGTVIVSEDSDTGLAIEYDDQSYGTVSLTTDDVNGDETCYSRIHGKGGATSQAAKGRGRNPHQDQAGKFSAGRPGSQRDPKTGQFVG